MKKARKGFTLIELLIVISILGALSASMAMSSSSAAAKAKATTIANNLRICTSASQLYYFESGDIDDATNKFSATTTKTMLNATVPNFADFSDGTIKFESEDNSGKDAPDKWRVKVTLSGSDATKIMSALQDIKGFSKATGTEVTYNVFSGTIEEATD